MSDHQFDHELADFGDDDEDQWSAAGSGDILLTTPVHHTGSDGDETSDSDARLDPLVEFRARRARDRRDSKLRLLREKDDLVVQDQQWDDQKEGDASAEEKESVLTETDETKARDEPEAVPDTDDIEKGAIPPQAQAHSVPIPTTETKKRTKRWDFAIVFEDASLLRKGAAGKSLTKTERTKFLAFKAFVRGLFQAGVDMKMRSSRDHVLCVVYVPEARLRYIADLQDYNVLLEYDALTRLACRGLPEHRIGPFKIKHDPAVSKLNPFQFIYGRYDMDPALQALYPPIFNRLDRIMLTNVYLEQVFSWKLGGDTAATSEEGVMDMTLHDLVRDSDHPLVAFFPLHDRKHAAEFTDTWLSWRVWPWDLPLDDIRGYFGEKIGMYYMFLGLYTTAIIPLALAGVVAFVFMFYPFDMSSGGGEQEEEEGEQGNGWEAAMDPESPVLPMFGVFVSLWAIATIEALKRQQQIYAMRWGQLNFLKTEHTRPEFSGQDRPSLVTGRAEPYFPLAVKRRRFVVSTATVVLMILIVATAVGVVSHVQQWCLDAGGFLETNASYISGSISAVQIMILNVVYRTIAIRLNEYENHRTDSEYESSLVFKIFAFQVINSYASLVNIAFVKPMDEMTGTRLEELKTGLMAIFVVQLVLSNLIETGIPWIVNRIQGLQIHRCLFRLFCCCCHRSASKNDQQDEERRDGAGVDGELSEVDAAVEEAFFVLDEYDPMLSQLDDYAELLVQFGYITFFVTAFPLAPLLALATNWVEIRSDGYKLVYVCRRPEACGAQNVGPWQAVMVQMAHLAVACNAAIFCFTSTYLEDHYDITGQDTVYAFIIYLAAVFAAAHVIDLVVPDVPLTVQLQRARQNFICEKAIDRIPDNPSHDTIKALSRRTKVKISPGLNFLAAASFWSLKDHTAPKTKEGKEGKEGDGDGDVSGSQ